MRFLTSALLLAVSTTTIHASSIACPADGQTVQTLDGSCNNVIYPERGMYNGAFRRIASLPTYPPAYADGISTMVTDRPNPRKISNILCQTPAEDITDERDMNELSVFFGQIFNHDGHTTAGEGLEPVPIPVTDTMLDGSADVIKAPIAFSRMFWDRTTGTSTENPRQVTELHTTNWIDASVIYGVNTEWESKLRSFVGGQLLSQQFPAGEFPPYASVLGDLTNKPFLNPQSRDPSTLFACGDFRCNEQPALLAMHTIFLRLHNKLARELQDENNDELNDEQIYQQTRRVIRAIIQKLAIKDYFPAITGVAAKPYQGYQMYLDGRSSLEFVIGALRIGHSQVRSDLGKIENPLDKNKKIITTPLRQLYFRGKEYLTQHAGDLENHLLALLRRKTLRIDAQITEDMRTFLFSPTAGLDLIALNIQRGRDAGVQDYNTIRQALGLPLKKSFDEITSDPAIVAGLRALYPALANGNDDVSKIDLFIGGIIEDHVKGSSLGETFQAIWLDAANNLRHGDRFWYERVGTLDPTDTWNDKHLRNKVESYTLKQLLMETTALGGNNIRNNGMFVTDENTPIKYKLA